MITFTAQQGIYLWSNAAAQVRFGVITLVLLAASMLLLTLMLFLMARMERGIPQATPES